eukprot:TRINITY_DN28334_c0_g1_i1.p1 TRINITY_DN28334_c0_g1~~TRINITY_DN28334_c0_g1_i1.p1  ORF type:complete len:300 (+),score=73.34 TRINITY_DN28334_c0_g1_i1:75-902(+)
MAAAKSYETLLVSQTASGVCTVTLNRPNKGNAFNPALWKEVRECFQAIAQDTTIRCVVLRAAGKHFTVGLDLMASGDILQGDGDAGRRAWALKNHVAELQASYTAFEKCPQPVIVAVHGACVGAGIDLSCAADIRMCSEQAWFCIKEVDVGLAADVGTLQRLPKVIGNASLAAELCYTARRFEAKEAKDMGLFSHLFPDQETLDKKAAELAEVIAAKSPVAIAGTKANILYSRDHTVADSLDYIAVWNSAMLQSQDLQTAIMASMQKEKPVFSKL